MRRFLLALVVTQDSASRSVARALLEGAGHRVIEAEGGAQAIALLANGLDPDLLLCDASSSSADEPAVYRELLRHIAPGKMCLIAESGNAEFRHEAAELGIVHFLDRPLLREDLNVLLVTYAQPAVAGVEHHLVAHRSTGRSIVDMPRRPAQGVAADRLPAIPHIEALDNGDFFLAAAPKMIEIYRQVKLLADIDVNVLILGESGTGKEIVARLIHKHSRRSQEKFLKVNCAALPTDLLESEFFGHRRGAFTGAINDRAGKFEQADRGTLLLDEIGEIGVSMQAKLLHVLQDGQFARLGAQETTHVNVRVLAATNVQMESALSEKKFREDLYYRLSVFTIKVPPLRERREEIPYLIEQMICRAPAELTKGFGSCLSSRLMDVALAYEWRGNLRELRNFVTRTIVMRDSEAAARELEAKVAAADVAFAGENEIEASPIGGIRSVVRDVKDRAEVQIIQNALEACGWNRRRAAQYLNISYRGLLYKIQQHRLRPWPAGASQPARQNAQSV